MLSNERGQLVMKQNNRAHTSCYCTELRNSVSLPRLAALLKIKWVQRLAKHLSQFYTGQKPANTQTLGFCHPFQSVQLIMTPWSSHYAVVAATNLVFM